MSVCCYCSIGNIRLANGNGPFQGRVEVFYNGEWGTVCDDGFDFSAADVVCRQLGCQGATKVSCCGAYGQGSGPIWLDGVVCTGREISLFGCAHNGFGNVDCGHGEDVSVVCDQEQGLYIIEITLHVVEDSFYYIQVSVLSMAVARMKDVWKYFLMESGAQCVMIDSMTQMQMWCVENWDIQEL